MERGVRWAGAERRRGQRRAPGGERRGVGGRANRAAVRGGRASREPAAEQSRLSQRARRTGAGRPCSGHRQHGGSAAVHPACEQRFGPVAGIGRHAGRGVLATARTAAGGVPGVRRDAGRDGRRRGGGAGAARGAGADGEPRLAGVERRPGGRVQPAPTSTGPGRACSGLDRRVRRGSGRSVRGGHRAHVPRAVRGRVAASGRAARLPVPAPVALDRCAEAAPGGRGPSAAGRPARFAERRNLVRDGGAPDRPGLAERPQRLRSCHRTGRAVRGDGGVSLARRGVRIGSGGGPPVAQPAGLP